MAAPTAIQKADAARDAATGSKAAAKGIGSEPDTASASQKTPKSGIAARTTAKAGKAFTSAGIRSESAATTASAAGAAAPFSLVERAAAAHVKDATVANTAATASRNG